MKYISTRKGSGDLTSAEAILRGIADDGGLFVPDTIPKVTQEWIAALAPLSYAERAKRVLSLFLDDYTADEISDCVEAAYGGGKFDADGIAPLKFAGNTAVLELWHGPTSAFKDMALQLLPQLLSLALEKTGESREILILAATSGDTGKAALAGFAGAPRTKIMVFYPDGGVSEMQRLQMATQPGDNVAVVAVRGNFDDTQSGVKAIFADKALAEKISAKARLSSANSINWGRLAPQIVYYFSAYADLVAAGRVKCGDTVNFTVPTGNFGNILAGFYARRMGLPVYKLVCASNKNDILTDFLRTGYTDRNREFFRTISPSMDILVSSNVERLLWHMTGDAGRVSLWMKELAEQGRYDVGAGMLQRLQDCFWADSADDAATMATIKEVFDTRRYLLDPHTAVAWRVAESYRARTKDERPMVVVSTASPYKFPASVLEALGEGSSGDPFALIARLEKASGLAAPKGLAALKDAPVLHTAVSERGEMAEKAIRFAGL